MRLLNKVVVCLLVCCSLIAWKPSLEGDYVRADGVLAFKLTNGRIVFANRDGTIMTLPGKNGEPAVPYALRYVVKGNQILIVAPHGEPKIDILPDGSLRMTDRGNETFRKK